MKSVDLKIGRLSRWPLSNHTSLLKTVFCSWLQIRESERQDLAWMKADIHVDWWEGWGMWQGIAGVL